MLKDLTESSQGDFSPPDRPPAVHPIACDDEFLQMSERDTLFIGPHEPATANLGKPAPEQPNCIGSHRRTR